MVRPLFALVLLLPIATKDGPPTPGGTDSGPALLTKLARFTASAADKFEDLDERTRRLEGSVNRLATLGDRNVPRAEEWKSLLKDNEATRAQLLALKKEVDDLTRAIRDAPRDRDAVSALARRVDELGRRLDQARTQADQRDNAGTLPPYLDAVLADVPPAYRPLLLERKGWSKADQSAEYVWRPVERRWAILAVASSRLQVNEPRLACEIKADAAVLKATRGIRVERVTEFHGGQATQRIKEFTAGGVPGLAALGEWEWSTSSGERMISVVYGREQ